VWDPESGQLHRELEGFTSADVLALVSHLSADGQQPRLVVGAVDGPSRGYDPEAGSELHHLSGHAMTAREVACIASSSAAPHHPRLVAASHDRAARVWDGETGKRLPDLRGHEFTVYCVAVWKEHTGGHDRIASCDYGGKIRVWDGEALTLLRVLFVCYNTVRLSPFKSAEGPIRLLIKLDGGQGLQIWDPEEGRLLHDGINRGCPQEDCHLFESAQGRQLLAIVGRGEMHTRHPGDTMRGFIDVWDLGEAPTRGHVRGAHKHG
jgi:WD40 repeat protein